MLLVVLLIPHTVFPCVEKRSSYKMKVTAYDPGCKICCGKWADNFVTSTGTDARICNGVAAAPLVIPYGTRLFIPGVGERVVDDTGGGMRQSAKQEILHLDLRMKTHEEALKWGVRWVDVEIIQYGKRKPRK